MKKGFTMIELIFVIVILGILVAVAIPKLVATRDDAEFSKFSQNLSALITDCIGFYTSQGKYEKDISKMTNINLINKSEYKAELPFRNTGCIKFIIYNEDDNVINIKRGALEIQAINKENSYCKKIHEIPSVSNYIKSGKYIINSAVLN